MENEWYIFYTYPRAEKNVLNELCKRDYNAFLPLIKSTKVWSNRQKKTTYKALFPNYIFVNTCLSQVYRILDIPQISTFVKTDGKPSTIKQVEIEAIKKMISLEGDLQLNVDYEAGEPVKVINGPLSGYEGLLIKKNGKTKFGIRLNEINQSILVEIDIKDIRKKNVEL